MINAIINILTMRRNKTAVQLKKQEAFRMLALICQEIASRPKMGTHLSDPTLWPKTRELADNCGESIYMMRNILLQLVDEGKVIKHASLLSNSLRWHINEGDGI
ncbi:MULTISPECIES: hypothetical protein [Erwiniaceae]|nr:MULTISPECIES: hypothetical protein [Erwiniaceae]UDQ80286.1 hypothetical protein LJN55_23335 [Erwinia rhapontici]